MPGVDHADAITQATVINRGDVSATWGEEIAHAGAVQPLCDQMSTDAKARSCRRYQLSEPRSISASPRVGRFSAAARFQGSKRPKSAAVKSRQPMPRRQVDPT